MVIEASADLPAEAPDELLICRVIVTPPERPADKPIPESTQSVSPPHRARGPNSYRDSAWREISSTDPLSLIGVA
jgi:hypothetical protein